MDGVNGISGGHALVGGIAYALLGLWLSNEFLAMAGTTVAAGALAFLPWNVPRARVFLGDAGSYAQARRSRCWPHTRSCTVFRPRRR